MPSTDDPYGLRLTCRSIRWFRSSCLCSLCSSLTLHKHLLSRASWNCPTFQRNNIGVVWGLRLVTTVTGTEVYFKVFVFSSPSHLWSLFVFVSLPGAAEGARSLHVSSGLQAWTLLNCCYLVQEFPAISPSFPDLDSDWSQTKGSSLRMSEVKRLLPLKQV